MTSIKQFGNLEIWKLSRILCNDIYKLAVKTDLRKDYKSYNQIDGSSGSVMDNIAEGFERSYASKEEFELLQNQTLEISRKIGAFINYLSKSDFKGSKYKN